MVNPAYSWLVELNNGATYQVDADRIVTDGGGISFYIDAVDEKYLICWLPIGRIAEVQIMSQMTGEPNGMRYIGNAANTG